jgi:hypothetical protein
MGLLDDAIREHLDLKRRLGGDPEEIKRLEREALGPVRREPTTPDAQFDDEPIREPYEDEAIAAEGPHAIAASSYSTPFDEGDDYEDDDTAFFDEQPTQMHQAEPEPQEEEHGHRRFGLFGRKSPKHEEPAPAPQDDGDDFEPLAEHQQADSRGFDERADIGSAEAADYEYLVEDDLDDDDPFAREDDPPAAAPEARDPEPPSLSIDDTPPPPRRPRFTEQRQQTPIEPEPADHDEPDDPALHAADTAERAPRPNERWNDETQLFEFDEDEPEDEPEPEEPAEDVLEGTPDFLQDTPDHDRLWFEQKPPRDFDFGN